MSIKFKVIEKGRPGVVGGGVKKYYALTQLSGEQSLDDLIDEIEKKSSLRSLVIRWAIYALVDVMRDRLADGKIVRLGELGSLRVNISSNAKEKAAEVKVSSIKGARVVFTPGKDLKKMLHTLTYEKV